MSIDFNKFGKSPNAQQSSQPSAVATSPAPVKTGVVDFNKFGKSGTYTPAPTAPTTEDKGIDYAGMAKGLISAPATMIARPVQLAAAIAGVDEDTLDQFSKDKLGGIVAPVVRGQGEYGFASPSDLIKEAGRGAQTVALGLGPVSGGALFGAGASAERQGSDIASVPGVEQAVVETGIGAAGGKFAQLVGKPLLSVSGKVIGTITPKTLQDVAAKGTQAMADFAARHEILSPEGKAAVASFEQGARKIDEGVGSIFGKAKEKVGEAVKSQYPNAEKKAQDYYANMEVDRLMQPATAPGKTFNKAADVLKQSEQRGIDLRKVLTDNKVYAHEHVQDGKFDTMGVADTLADEAKNGGAEFLRPALAEAEGGAQRVTMDELRQEMLTRVASTPDTVLSTEQKKTFVQKILKEYGAGSVTSKRFRNGYGLTDLYNSKLQTSSKLYKEPKGGGQISIADSQTAQQKKIESQVFDKFLRERAPAELGLDDYFKAQEAKFMAANYLRTLDGSKAPQSLFQRAVKKTSQLSGATIGAQNFGPFGMFSGYQAGGIMADTFANMPNPVKISFLRSIGKTEPEIYQAMREYISEEEAQRLGRTLLGPGDTADINLQPFKNEKGAIPMGQHYTPLTPEEKMKNDFTHNFRQGVNTKFLAPPADRIITPNTQGTPNPIGRPYVAGEQGPVTKMEQRAGEAHNRALQKWRMADTTETFEEWMKDKTPEGNPKRLFKGK
jgi:hypothetical protein